MVGYAACIGAGLAETASPAAIWARSGRKYEHASELNSYIARLQQRLRLGAWLRGAAIFTGTALVVTVALVLVLNPFAFPAQASLSARIALLARTRGRGHRLPSRCR